MEPAASIDDLTEIAEALAAIEGRNGQRLFPDEDTEMAGGTVCQVARSGAKASLPDGHTP
jgi:hypothetical protein